jgi:WD40 repeat protein
VALPAGTSGVGGGEAFHDRVCGLVALERGREIALRPENAAYPVVSDGEVALPTGIHDRTVRLCATGVPIGPPMKYDSWIYGALLTTDETHILSWSDDRTVRLWHAVTGAPIGPAMKQFGTLDIE